MNILMIITYIMLAIVLFYILNYFDANNKNSNLIHIVLPVVYIVLLASLLKFLDLTIWCDFLFLIIIFELIIRLIYVKKVMEQENLVNSSYYIKIYGLSILFSCLINTMFISKVEEILPTAEEIRPGLWFLIIIFIYLVIKDNIKIDITKDTNTFIEKKEEYVVVSYAKLKNMYSDSIITSTKELIPVVYAIMVYENYKRPKVLRNLDNIKYRFSKKQIKMGIMQIASKKIIDDYQSIELAVKKLEKITLKLKTTAKKKTNKIDTEEVIKNYYGKIDSSDVIDIYNKIIDFNKK